MFQNEEVYSPQVKRNLLRLNLSIVHSNIRSSETKRKKPLDLSPWFSSIDHNVNENARKDGVIQLLQHYQSNIIVATRNKLLPPAANRTTLNLLSSKSGNQVNTPLKVMNVLNQLRGLEPTIRVQRNEDGRNTSIRVRSSLRYHAQSKQKDMFVDKENKYVAVPKGISGRNQIRIPQTQQARSPLNDSFKKDHNTFVGGNMTKRYKEKKQIPSERSIQ